MYAKFVESFMKSVPSDSETQGLTVKLPFMEAFVPVNSVETVSDEPDMLRIEISSASYPVYPRVPQENADCKQVFLVHKSQVIFRICERL